MDRDQGPGEVDRADLFGRHRGVSARGIGGNLQSDKALFRHPDHHRRGVDNGGVGADQPALIKREQRFDLALGQPLGGSLCAGPANLFVMARDQIDRPLGLEALRRQRFHRFEQRDQRAFVINRAAAPDGAIGNRSGEGIVLPVLFGPGGHRHHILMRHHDDRLGAGIAARPGIDQRLADLVLAHRGVGLGIGAGEPGLQLVPFRQLIVSRVLVANRLEPHGCAKVLSRPIDIERGGSGDLDLRSIGHSIGREHRGPRRNHRAQRQSRCAQAQNPLLHRRPPQTCSRQAMRGRRQWQLRFSRPPSSWHCRRPQWCRCRSPARSQSAPDSAARRPLARCLTGPHRRTAGCRPLHRSGCG